MKNLSNAKKIIKNYKIEKQIHQSIAKKSKIKNKNKSCKSHD